MADLPCPDGGGSLNNPDAPDQIGTVPPFDPLTAPLCVGEWDISTADDVCARNERLLQESYIAETLNISGAPVNVYRLLGVHEQGVGSIIDTGAVYGSTLVDIANVTDGSDLTYWQSINVGAAIISQAEYLGVDFGIKTLTVGGASEYGPPKTKWTSVGAITIKQQPLLDNYAQQVRLETATGEMEWTAVTASGTGNGTLTVASAGPNATEATITAMATSPTTFSVLATLKSDGSTIVLGTATVGTQFNSLYASFTIAQGLVAFVGDELFTFDVNYVWQRQAVFNLTQTPNAVTLSLQSPVRVRAVRVVPTMFTGAGNWQVLAFDVLDSAPTNLNNIQDLFFMENRDRDYEKVPVTLKAQYTPNDSISDLSKFGLSILDQYSFTVSFAQTVQKLGRPIVVGDIIELPPEMQYDQNMLPVRKFLEVTDTAWSSSGFSPGWKPMVYRFQAQQALPSQETRDIFGTLDTQKYLIADSILGDGIGEQLNVGPLTATEEAKKEALDAVPETGSDEQLSTDGQPQPIPLPAVNVLGQPPAMNKPFKANSYQEDGLPPTGEPYEEGYALPAVAGATDGDYFRLYYPEDTKIPPRLYRYSAVKNRWIYLETDRRGDYSSYKPSVRKILESSNKQGLKKKLT